jgi:hypothetical protein
VEGISRKYDVAVFERIAYHPAFDSLREEKPPASPLLCGACQRFFA